MRKAHGKMKMKGSKRERAEGNGAKLEWKLFLCVTNYLAMMRKIRFRLSPPLLSLRLECNKMWNLKTIVGEFSYPRCYGGGFVGIWKLLQFILTFIILSYKLIFSWIHRFVISLNCAIPRISFKTLQTFSTSAIPTTAPLAECPDARFRWEFEEGENREKNGRKD